MVLGTQWLSTLGEISWDLKLMTMKFWYLQNLLLLQGLLSSGSSILGSEEMFKTPIKKGLILQITTPESGAATAPDQLPAALQDLLKGFDVVFDVPVGLPPI